MLLQWTELYSAIEFDAMLMPQEYGQIVGVALRGRPIRWHCVISKVTVVARRGAPAE